MFQKADLSSLKLIRDAVTLGQGYRDRQERCHSVKIYIDVSNLMYVRFISGIQRVVREVAARLAVDTGLELVLLEYEESEDKFGVLSLPAFLAYYRDDHEAGNKDGAGNGDGFGSRDRTGNGDGGGNSNKGDKDSNRNKGDKDSNGNKAGNKVRDSHEDRDGIRTEERLGLREFPHGSIFLEMDSVWHSRCNRMMLYPELKARGVRIAVFFQDLIPIMWPQYAAAETVCSFLGYMTACVTYGDLFISSTRTNIEYLQDFMKRIGVKNPAPCAVSWLGTDFREQREYKPGKKLEEIAAGGKFLLMVGTVEPRKNHKLVLDAMEESLFSEGWRLVIAGRQGWNVQETAERIRNHGQMGRQLHWIEDASDGDIEFLYRHCRFVVFPSFTEGFGLPVVEACGRGIPVLSSDHPVLREVGGAYCRYFSAADSSSLIRAVREANREPAYEQMRNALKGYRAVGWDQVADQVSAALKELGSGRELSDFTEAVEIRQMVTLSARAEDFLRSLPFIENFMPFIQEVVLCCPDAMEAQVRGAYGGRLRIRYLTDSVLLAGAKLPEDHAARNIFLRTRAVRHAIIDQVFIMSDDDYRPLREITKDIFYKEGKFQAYCLGDLRDWKGTQGKPTSFDIGMWKSRQFLMGCGYSTYMFASHMPQAIHKGVFLEMLIRYPEIANGAATEWSAYFNYLVSEYPDQVEIRPYVTMNWPGFLEDWNVRMKRPEYLFENFYDVVYEEREVYRGKGKFVGFSKEFHPNILEENGRKAEICRREEERHEKELELHRNWQREYAKRRGMTPVYAVCRREGRILLLTPASMPMLRGDFLRMDFQVMLETASCQEQQWQLTWTVRDEKGRLISVGSSRFQETEESFQVLLMAPEEPGSYQVEWNLYAGEQSVLRLMALEVRE